MRRPLNSTTPPSGLRLPASRLNIVVLPAPLGPIRPAISPALTLSETASTAATPPKRLDTDRVSSMSRSSSSKRHGERALVLESYGDFPLDGATLVGRFRPRKINWGEPPGEPCRHRES